jgi:hypothetical protein
MAADAAEANDWVGTRSKSPLDQGEDREFRLESSFVRRSVTTHVAAHRVKRIAGF